MNSVSENIAVVNGGKSTAATIAALSAKLEAIWQELNAAMFDACPARRGDTFTLETLGKVWVAQVSPDTDGGVWLRVARLTKAGRPGRKQYLVHGNLFNTTPQNGEAEIAP